MTIEVMESEPIEISCPSIVCENQDASYRVSEDLCWGYDWDVIGGTFVGNNAATNSVVIRWDNVDPSGFGYILVYDNHCGATCPGIPTIIKVPVIPENGTIAGDDVICPFTEALYRMPQWPATEFNWSITSGNAQLFTTDQPNEIVVYPFGSGNITLVCNYKNVLTGCAGIAVKNIEVYPQEEIIGPTEICVGDNPNFHLTNGGIGDWVLQVPVGNPNQTTASDTASFNFFAPGNYVLFVTGTDFCPPKPHRITVLPQPNAPDSISGPDTICLELPIEYSVHNAQQGSIFAWEISGGTFSGGGTTATGNKITAVFSGAPPYELKAKRISTSPAGCESSEITKTMSLRQIDVNIDGPTTVCDNSYHSYTSSFKAGDSYEWFIIPETRGSVVAGDGTDDISILWNTTNPGQFVDVVVAVRACGGIHYDTMSVFVTPGPSISLTPDTPTICAGSQVIFTAQGSPALTSGDVTWIFGNGDTISNNSFTQAYTYPTGLLNSTTYTVTVIIENANGCGNTVTANYQINVEPVPVAFISPAMDYEFCDDSLSISVPLSATVQSGAGNTTGFQWFRNGSPIATGPNFTATSFGSYYCVVQGINGCSGVTNTVNIIKVCDTSSGGGGHCWQIYQDSSSIASTVTNCDTIELTGSITGSGVINSSYFTAPAISTIPVNGTTATYGVDQAGIYIFEFHSNVTVGGVNCTYKDSIHVHIPLVADLMYSVACGSSGQYNVSLFDHSTYLPGNGITNYQFIINSTSVQNGPADSYSGTFAAGTTLNVTLNVTAASGTCSTTQQIELPPFPHVDFEMDDTICVGAPLAFTNLSSTGTGVTYNWDFFDGAETTVDNPSRVFGSAGSKDITLTVRNALGCESQLTKSVMVLGNNFSNALFSDPSIACEGSGSILEHDPTIFDTPEIIYWQPDSFGISTSLTQGVINSGAYFATLTNRYGCVRHTEYATVEFIPGPEAVITGPSVACVDDEIVLRAYDGNGYTYSWTVNGTPAGTGVELNLSSPTPTVFEVELEVTDGPPHNCTASTTLEVTVNPLPDAPSVSLSIFRCKPYIVELTASANTTGTFNWSNGGTGDTIRVNKGGLYTVTFTNDAGCTSEQSIYVPKSLEEYVWIYPVGCYTICDEKFDVDQGIDIPDALIPFDYWHVTNDGGNILDGTGLAQILIGQWGSGVYEYEFELNGCTKTRQSLDLDVIDCACEFEVVQRDSMRRVTNYFGFCYYEVIIGITNPTGNPQQVTLSSDIGSFIPSTVTAAPGSNSYTLVFIPNAGLAQNTLGTIYLEAFMFDDEGNRIPCLTQNDLEFNPSQLCGSSPRIAQNSSEMDDELVEDLSNAIFDFSIFPNPAKRQIQVNADLSHFPENSTNEFMIYDFTGKLMLSEILEDDIISKEVNISTLPAGVYMVVIRNNGIVKKVKKLIVNP
jgi:hypothetical protein